LDKTRSLFRLDASKNIFTPLKAFRSSSIQVKEKHIEEWIAKNPDLLFSYPEEVMIIAQEVSGELMADLLAVDSQGSLIIIEIKRDSSDRNTIGQILDYAAILSKWSDENFNSRWQDFPESKGRDLFEAFSDFIGISDFDRKDFLKRKRLFILASSEDESIKRIISWLRDTYKVPIDFVPFQFYQDYQNSDQLILEIEKIEIQQRSGIGNETWQGDWFFNTNETNGKGAYEKMFKQSVISVWGYEDGEERLNEPITGQRVFAYVNGSGIAATGRIGEKPAVSSDWIFGRQSEREFSRSVNWDYVVDLKDAVTYDDVSHWDYNLPIRSALCRIWKPDAAKKIAAELKSRASKTGQYVK